MNGNDHPQPASTEWTRRTFLKAGATGAIALATATTLPGAESTGTVKKSGAEELPYLTRPEDFRTFCREKPAVDQFSAEQCRERGLDRETWQLEVQAEPGSKCQLRRPFLKSAGTAFAWKDLMQLAEQHAVRFLHVLTCTNIADSLGMGLWEGVPLRQVLWATQPSEQVRRVYYYGYHNEDPKQRFISSLPIGRVLEDPPGELPVILCYKLNGQWLPLKNGGPVRLFVPGVYGNKSVKWLQQVVLTSDFHANDTYAQWDNDVESPLKTHARFLNVPRQVKAGQTVMVTGVAQVGISGLARVQYAVERTEKAAAEDPYFTKLNWMDANILPPPGNWGGGLPEGKLSDLPLQFDGTTGQPSSWPMRYTLAYWTATLPALASGQYRLRCRTIDANGVAQPLPRPFPRSGNNKIQEKDLTVSG